MQELGESIARQAAKLTSGNIPYHRCHTRFMNEGWLRGESSWGLFSFLGIRPFLGISWYLQKSRGSMISARGLATDWSLGGDKSCIQFVLHVDYYQYSYLLCCCIKLSLSQPTSFLFVHFSSPSCWGRKGEGWASGCLVGSCQLPS